MLDHRVLRTPARHPLIVPSRALAMAIAAEWEWQVRWCPSQGSLVEPWVRLGSSRQGPLGMQLGQRAPCTPVPGELWGSSGPCRATSLLPAVAPTVSPSPLQVQRIQPFTMPLMSLAATALDQPKPREDVIATMLQVGRLRRAAYAAAPCESQRHMAGCWPQLL